MAEKVKHSLRVPQPAADAFVAGTAAPKLHAVPPAHAAEASVLTASPDVVPELPSTPSGEAAGTSASPLDTRQASGTEAPVTGPRGPTKNVAPKSKKSLVERADGRQLRKQAFYLPVGKYQELRRYCFQNEVDISTAITASLDEFLERHSRQDR